MIPDGILRRGSRVVVDQRARVVRVVIIAPTEEGATSALSYLAMQGAEVDGPHGYHKGPHTYWATIAIGAVSGVALDRLATLLESRLRTWIDRRRSETGENWREPEGYL